MKVVLWVIAIPVGLFMLLGLIGSCQERDPAVRQQNLERRAVAQCWDEQKRKSLDAATQQFVAGACERMERDFEAKYKRKP